MITKDEFKYFLEETGNMLEDLLSRRASIHRLKYPRGRYYYNIRKFEDAGLIKPKIRKKYANAYVLTDKGRSLIRKANTKTKRTDSLSTIILFDIPEEKSRERTIFRRYLIRNGYTQIQKSALISNLELSPDLKELIAELKIDANIKIISGRINYI